MLRPSIRPRASTSNWTGSASYQINRKSSVSITLTPVARQRVSSYNDSIHYKKRHSPSSSNPYKHKRSVGLSEEYLLASSETDSLYPKSASNYRSFDNENFTRMMREMGQNELVVRNGAKKSIGTQSKRSIIVGPPSCDDVLDELDMMETSLRKFKFDEEMDEANDSIDSKNVSPKANNTLLDDEDEKENLLLRNNIDFQPPHSYRPSESVRNSLTATPMDDTGFDSDKKNKTRSIFGSWNTRRRKTFYQQSRVFCQRSTLHGLSDLCRAENWWLRIFWLTTFLGALAAAVYGCYHILEQYMESPVVVSYFVQESDLKFPLPDLVICPFNRFNQEFLKNHSIRQDVAQHMQLSFGMSAKHPAQRRELHRFMTNASMFELDLAMNGTLKRLNMTFDEFLDAASLKCSDFFVDCAFPTGTVNCCNNISYVTTYAVWCIQLLQFSASSRDIKQDYFLFLGKCYRIRGVDQSGPGYGYGMTIVVSLPKNLYSLAVNNWLNDGILVKLAEPGQGIDYDMTFIPVGTHALMPLKATKYEFMDDPPRFECLTEASLNYSRVDCFDACFLEAAHNHCHCAVVGNFNRLKLPLCTTNQYYSCIFSFLTKQFHKVTDAEEYFFSCRQRCKPRCTYWQYQSAISYSKFPSEEARTFAANDEEWIRMKNTIIVDLYYEKLEFTRIKHYRAMTIHGFIANLGGQYSLWLGGSILTLMQMLVFIVNYTIGRCRRFLSGRQNNGQQRSDGDCFNYTGGGGHGNRSNFTYQAQPTRSSSSVFWRSRSASAGTGARRQSTLSDDLHPQLQALTQMNQNPNILIDDHHQRRPHQSNGNCCTDQNNLSDQLLQTMGGGTTSYGFYPVQYSSWTDIGRGGGGPKLSVGNPVVRKDNLNGGCRQRSPSIEVDHFGSALYPRNQWDPSLLDDFRQKQWVSEN